MNTKTRLALATLLLSFTLVGCGGGSGPDEGTGGGNTGGGDTGGGNTGGGDTGVIVPGDLTGESSSAFEYINKVLKDAGFTAVSIDERLTLSASKHAEYLAVNDVAGHYEDSSLPSYYGYDLGDRVALAGWDNGSVGENVAGGSTSDNIGEELTRNLMTAVYHRFGFFSGWEAMGVGMARGTSMDVIVFDMGNISYDNPAPGRTYFLWPAEGINYANSLFFTETPNPLSDIPENMSGNPISVSFNSFEIDCSTLDMTSFSLSSAAGGVEPVLKTMTAATDPNDRLDACEFVLFPRNILIPGEMYNASFEYSENGNAKTIAWSFETKALPVGSEVLYYPVGDSAFTVERGVKYVLFPETREATKLLVLFSESYTPGEAIPTTTYMDKYPVVEFSGTAGTVELTQDDSGDVITFNVN